MDLDEEDGQDPDPLAAYRAKKAAAATTTTPATTPAAPSAPTDDPLAAYRASKNTPPKRDFHAEYRAGTLGRRMARENANDQDALDAEPGYVQRLSTHLLNAAQGIPGAERLEAAAGSLGSKLTDHPMDYDQSLATLRGETGKIGGKTSLAEHLMGSLAATPLLRGNMALQGAELGGADQLLSADDESAGERAVKTVGGAAGGAALGAAFRALGPVAGKVMSRIPAPVTSNLQVHGVAPMAPNLERALSLGATATSADDQAREMLSNALRTGGVSPGAAAATVPLDQPTSMMELGSRNVPALVRGARNVPSSTAAQTTDRFLAERAAGTGKRIESALTDATGHSATDTALPVEQLIAKRAAEAKPLYEQAEAYGEIQDPETVGEIQRLLRDPVFDRAWRRGQALARIEGSAPAGTPPTGLDQQGFRALTETPADQIQGDLFVPNARVQQANPTVRQINRWKKGLDAVINSGYGSENALSRDEARVYRGALNNVLDRVDAEVPAFQEARANFRGHSELAEAAESGAAHFQPSTQPGEAARQLAALSPGERAAYTNNALNQLVAKIRSAAANPNLPEAGRATNIVQRIMGTEDAGERLGMLFPDEATFQSFLKKMEDEALYPKTNQFLRNQSSTAAQLAEGRTPISDRLDAALHPRRTMLRTLRDREGRLTPDQANAIAQQATATGARLRNILRQMEADHAARDAGRQRLQLLTRRALVGGEQGIDDEQHHPDRAPE